MGCNYICKCEVGNCCGKLIFGNPANTFFPPEPSGKKIFWLHEHSRKICLVLLSIYIYFYVNIMLVFIACFFFESSPNACNVETFRETLDNIHDWLY